MNEPELPRVNRGDPPRASHYNALVESRNAARNMRGDGAYIAVEDTSQGRVIKWIGGPVGGVTVMPAKITGAGASAGLYQWTQQVWNASGGVWTAGNNTYSTLGEAYEINGVDSVAADTFVLLHRVVTNAGASILAFVAPTAPPSEVWVKLTSASAIAGQTNRWTYSGTRMVRTATGWAAYSPSTTISGIYNSREADNDSGGAQGNGIDITGSAFPAGFSLKSAATGTPTVRVYRETLADGTVVWTCDVANAVDGTCT